MWSVKKNFASLICIFCFPLMLMSCATPYQPAGLEGGYSDVKLGDNIYKVSFRGNGHASQDRVQNFLLYRCAELTINNGYQYFIILSSTLSHKDNSFNTSSTITSTSVGNYTGGGYYYGNTVYNAHPGQHYTIRKYENIAIIKMLKTNKNASTAFRAKTIIDSLRQQVKG